MYIIWPDEEYIDKVVESGIDTLFFNLNDGTLVEEMKRMCKKYMNMGIMVVPIQAYTQSSRVIPESEQFFDGTRYYKLSPCPRSESYIKELLKYPKELINEGLISIGIDFEDYSASQNPNDAVRFYRDWDTDIKCRCERCKLISGEDQRKSNIDIIRKELGSILFYNMPYPDPYICKKSFYWLNEYTYEEWSEWSRILKNTSRMKKQGVTLGNSSGIWAEKYSANAYLNRIEEAIKSPANDGYWIYSHMRFSKNSYWRKYPDDPQTIETLKQLPYQSFIDEEDPDFFNKLKNLNSKIDNYRKGFVFSIKSILYSIFK